MDTGLLIVLNLLTIPFVAEFELLGAKNGAIPRLLDVLNLKTVRTQRWLSLFMAFVLLIFVISLFATKKHQVSLVLALIVAAINIVVWTLLVIRVKRSRSATR